MLTNGTMGAIVEYVENKEVNELTFINDLTERHKAPVPSNVKDSMNGLKLYVLDICGYITPMEEKYIDYDTMTVIVQEEKTAHYMNFRDTLERLEMIQVKYNGSSFILEAKYRTDLSRKKISLKTPSVDADCMYENFEEACKACKDLFSLAKGYVEGHSVVTAKQYQIDYYTEKGKNLNEIEELTKGMTNQEALDFMREKCENAGLIVMEDISEVMPGVVELGAGVNDMTDVTDVVEVVAEEKPNPKKSAKVVDMVVPEVVAEEADMNGEVPADEFGFEETGS